MRLSFHGADRGVTGSCHLVEAAGRRVLVDCGLFQGGRGADDGNAAPFGFDPATIDAVLLTHAHLDHCGRLPLLVQRGFRGEVVATSATRELARIVLLDAAQLQEEDARRRTRRRRRGGDGDDDDDDDDERPLFTVLDALDALERFRRPVEYGRGVELAPGWRVTFVDAGHILGSAGLFVEIEERGVRRTLAFSGDVGNAGRPLLRSPATPPPADVAVLETTYGDRPHRSAAASVDELHDALAATFARGGNVVIPTFALERAQELLFHLRAGVESGRLPRSTPVYLDSPMAISATEIFARHPECCAPDVAAMIAAGRDPFAMPGLHLTREAAESMAINRVIGGAVILAGAGMCNGGRVRHHLKHNLWRAECSVVFVGYAAEGTLARRIVDGARTVRIFDEDVRVRARVHTINGFSAHADRDELLAWHRAVAPARTFLVHGDEAVMRRFAATLGDARVEMPALGDAVDLGGDRPAALGG